MQPKHIPLTRIKPRTPQSAGRCSIHLAKPVRAPCSFIGFLMREYPKLFATYQWSCGEKKIYGHENSPLWRPRSQQRRWSSIKQEQEQGWGRFWVIPEIPWPSFSWPICPLGGHLLVWHHQERPSYPLCGRIPSKVLFLTLFRKLKTVVPPVPLSSKAWGGPGRWLSFLPFALAADVIRYLVTTVMW